MIFDHPMRELVLEFPHHNAKTSAAPPALVCCPGRTKHHYIWKVALQRFVCLFCEAYFSLPEVFAKKQDHT